MICRDGIAG